MTKYIRIVRHFRILKDNYQIQNAFINIKIFNYFYSDKLREISRWKTLYKYNTNN